MTKYGILSDDPMLKHFEGDINLRMDNYIKAKNKMLSGGQTLSSFANGHMYYGFQRADGGWFFREWAPNADSVALFGDFNNWNRRSHMLTRLDGGSWEIFIEGDVPNLTFAKLEITAGGRSFDRIPLYSRRVVQNSMHNANAQIVFDDFKWTDSGFKRDKKLLIYEAHVGMAGEDYRVSTYLEFAARVLPRIKKCGYTAIQLMAIMEHPYYASFGYQVGSFFACSSRFGMPEDLKLLVNTAHEMGIAVLLDLVHSHAASNTLDGINEFDGSDCQFFHSGRRGNHPAWGTKLFDYGKNEVKHFLLSNLKFWLTEYHLDGFRFDGVTSMLYHHNGLGVNFDSYDKYFSMNTDTDAITYLQLANELIHEVRPEAVTVAEDMSGMPGMCIPVERGGIGFDYRLSMGVPDFWVRTLKSVPDENWDMHKMWYELTTRRPKEKNVGYCESHDQALVGDKTIMFWLADAEMYDKMSVDSQSHKIDRAIALHKLIRLVTFSLAGEGYMNFMGNEFGHPEWIDFPREGNNSSFHYARRQWSLADNEGLKYKFLLNFDREMIKLAKRRKLLGGEPEQLWIHQEDKLLCFRKGSYIFAFNFHPSRRQSMEVHYKAGRQPSPAMDTDSAVFGGFGRGNAFSYEADGLKLELEARTALVLSV